MSLVDKFENRMEPAFTHSFDPESARRQFRVSLFLVAAMAFAAFILGFALPLNAPRSSPPTPAVSSDASDFSGRLLSLDSAD
ncbi:hypothetical protein MSC49_22370 [Methylosinus sp. C49]|jgi:hypothetical protein|uniref:hypothetical protein n=1 Tax=Methylosinus sp. C49 TaxID=2699395 RepID=UPI001366C8E6|nr:hypothetical protein [Methylosinus sp. C49]BBU62302.1 hypothetical protein MSC49_22370 [Methylosinus sp. C49]